MASTLPSELLDRIVDFLALDIGVFDSYGFQEMKRYKHTLGACMLTCRYWWLRCRPHLFEYTILRSPDDLDGLLSLLSSSDSIISQSVRVLWVYEYKRNIAPWSHRILLSLLPRLDRLETIQYQNHPKARTAVPPTVSRGLSALYSNVRNVTSLTLSQQDFISFSEFLHIIGAIRSLKALTCDHLSWKKTPANPSMICGAWELERISASLCKEHWPFIWLLIARPKGKAASAMITRAVIGPEDLLTVGELARSFNSVFLCEVHYTPLRQDSCHIYMELPGSIIKTTLEFSLFQSAPSPSNSSDPPLSFSSFQNFVVQMDPPVSQLEWDEAIKQEILSYDWKRIDSLLQLLVRSGLSSVTIRINLSGFINDTKPLMEALTQEIQACMPHMQRENGLELIFPKRQAPQIDETPAIHTAC